MPTIVQHITIYPSEMIARIWILTFASYEEEEEEEEEEAAAALSAWNVELVFN